MRPRTNSLQQLNVEESTDRMVRLIWHWMPSILKLVGLRTSTLGENRKKALRRRILRLYKWARAGGKLSEETVNTLRACRLFIDWMGTSCDQDVRVVITAATAREKLSQGGALSVSELGALSGYKPARLQQIVRGEKTAGGIQLRRTRRRLPGMRPGHEPIQHHDCVKFLREVGVPGLPEGGR